MPKHTLKLLVLLFLTATLSAQTKLTTLVNPFLGTAPLTGEEAGYVLPDEWRVWAGLVFPGASLPNAMVQLSPITEFRSGAGYEYEDTTISAFTHTNKGHWNLCHIPLLPVTGEVDPRDFASEYSHDSETAHPGYYQVLLKRYNINAELTTSLRCGYHKYTFLNAKDNQAKKLIANLAISNERVRRWDIEKDGDNDFKGYQRAGETVYFYAQTNHKILEIEMVGEGWRRLPVIHFAPSAKPLEIKIGLSFVSSENAKDNLKEIDGKSFGQVRNEADKTWEALLSKIKVTGGTQRQRELFYSTLYRSFLWPALRSDLNGEFTNQKREVVNKGFRYYTNPSFWDTYRNKLPLLTLLSPDVATDVMKSITDKGQISGYMPTFFHGDHAATFVSGSYLRGLKDFDVKAAYDLLLRNATVPGRGGRPHLEEYIEKGYISTPVVEHPHVESKAKAGVTKTLEYAYDDYAVALLAKALGDNDNYDMLMKRTSNYKNVFDSETELMRGRLDNGDFVEPFDPCYPYYEYMYREANAWQSTFFAPHDTEGLLKLFKSKDSFEKQVDNLFTIPWNKKHIARNVSSFIGQYCHGNQPDHSSPYMYYWVDKQEKSQKILNTLMNDFYGMGEHGLAYCGMDDAGEMSSWFVFNAIGLYTYSPADAEYIVTVPLFDRVEAQVLGGNTWTILKKGSGLKITNITCGKEKVDGYFVTHEQLNTNKELVITTK